MLGAAVRSATTSVVGRGKATVADGASRTIAPDGEFRQMKELLGDAPPPAPSVPGMGAFAQRTGITLRPGRDGGKGTPTYTYGKVSIDLPGDLDLKDDAAVQSAVRDMNDAADVMKRLYADY